MKKLGRKGFTLIELMIVIAIIAILAAILVPNFVRARAQGQFAACTSNLKNIGTACEMYAADHNGRYPQNGQDLNNPQAANNVGGTAYLQRFPTCPASNDGYAYQSVSNPDYYVIACNTGNHQQAGVINSGTNAGNNNWPRFDSQTGLMAPRTATEEADCNQNVTDSLAQGQNPQNDVFVNS